VYRFSSDMVFPPFYSGGEAIKKYPYP